jgi:conjugative relaxase-like TrwC/TraI family protein
LCGGLDPVTGQKLTSRLSTKRREAYDLTFSTPKSVSLLYALSSEKGALEIEKVTLKAMKETMLELEKNIQCRVRNKGQNENRISGNLVYGYFIHKNSRPVDGFPDPHLHIHTVVMNLTYDQVDYKWKAIEMRDKYENRQYYQAIFNSKLALGLQSIGLRTRKTDFNFELEGVFDLTKNDFSRRTAEINAEAIKRNIYDPKEKDKLGARTRKSKSEKLSQNELKNVYQNLISSDNQKDW